jgi:G3E family GTPase
MKTHYVNLQGAFHLKLLQACLDSLLYNNNNIASNHNKANNNYNNDDDSFDGETNKDHHTDVNSAAVVTSTSNIITSTSAVVATTDMKIFRMKGIVHIHQCTNLYILQAVHEIFDLQESSYSTGGIGDVTDGSNPIVIIGKNLDCDLIKDKLMSCIA